MNRRLLESLWMGLLTLAIVLAFVARQVDQDRSNALAKTACERSQRFVPKIVMFYEAVQQDRGFEVFSAQDLAAYASTVPEDCG